MTSSSLNPLKPPVRVLIRTRPAQIQKFHPSLDQADVVLIGKFCVQMFDTTDTAEICHLITKMSDEKGSERVDIIFDCDVPTNDCQPKVMAFKVKVQNSAPHYLYRLLGTPRRPRPAFQLGLCY